MGRHKGSQSGLDQGFRLCINGFQEPLDGVVATILDGDLEEGIAVLIQATDITGG